MAVTEPSTVYEMGAEKDGDLITLHDRIWGGWPTGTSRPRRNGPPSRRRRQGERLALTAPHTCQHHDSLDTLAESHDPA